MTVVQPGGETGLENKTMAVSKERRAQSMKQLVVKEATCNVGDTGNLGLIPGFGKIPWRRKQQPTPVSCLGNPMDRGLQSTGLPKSQT